MQVTHAQRSEAAHRDAENAQQLLAGNAAALEDLKHHAASTSEQMAELLEVVKAMKLAPAAAAAAAAAGSGAVERWHINAKDIVYEYEEDEDGDQVKTKLGAGSFGVVYVALFFFFCSWVRILQQGLDQQDDSARVQTLQTPGSVDHTSWFRVQSLT